MKKYVVVLLAALLLVDVFGALGVARTLDQAKIQVRVHIPVFQDLTVIQPAEVSFDYPWDGMESGEPLVIRNVGLVQVRSNADWALQVGFSDASGMRVSVRPAGDRWARWMPVDSPGSVVTGKFGVHELSWDVKIEAPRQFVSASRFSTTAGQRNLQLVFTLGQQ